MADTMPSLRNGSWYRCADGSIIEPLDLLHLFFFPSHGRDSRGDNVCFLPKHMKFSVIRDYLPQMTYKYQVDDFVDSLLALLLMTFVTTVSLVAGKYLWDAVDKRFNAIRPTHKKWYVVANISKAFFLGCLTVSPKYWIGFYKAQYLDEFQMVELKRTMVLYIATDLVALYMVPKLPLSTILHHVATTLMSLLVFGLNLRIKGRTGVLGFAKMGLFYGTLSTFPFLVNAYLALRVVYPKSVFVKVLCFFSLVTYLVCCAVNWSVHLLWLLGYWGHRDLSFFTLIYAAMIMFLVHDDIVLIKWLIRQNSPANRHSKNE